jgi:hypothetical protein
MNKNTSVYSRLGYMLLQYSFKGHTIFIMCNEHTHCSLGFNYAWKYTLMKPLKAHYRTKPKSRMGVICVQVHMAVIEVSAGCAATLPLKILPHRRRCRKILVGAPPQSPPIFCSARRRNLAVICTFQLRVLRPLQYC